MRGVYEEKERGEEGSDDDENKDENENENENDDDDDVEGSESYEPSKGIGSLPPDDDEEDVEDDDEEDVEDDDDSKDDDGAASLLDWVTLMFALVETDPPIARRECFCCVRR